MTYCLSLIGPVTWILIGLYAALIVFIAYTKDHEAWGFSAGAIKSPCCGGHHAKPEEKA